MPRKSVRGFAVMRENKGLKCDALQAAAALGVAAPVEQNKARDHPVAGYFVHTCLEDLSG
ncbi:hypothetical protein [Rhizobium bangladeshense]|uniref:hypothetical protein n=1 Tax=Rhizobium bangladeshense TaxID=1138189 RepID=UPI0007E582FE|nr:hypothetical protein [Rhizobium bangladeshense]